ncbi:MAG: hypothetical protein PHQ40_19255, partial [Anaerolineaceae bacterium]|nr:hypothetical protein [Anaerolineaceae bacterium]
MKTDISPGSAARAVAQASGTPVGVPVAVSGPAMSSALQAAHSTEPLSNTSYRRAQPALPPHDSLNRRYQDLGIFVLHKIP